MFSLLLRVRLRATFARLLQGSRRRKSRSGAALIGYGVLMLYVVGCFLFLFYNLFTTLAKPLNEGGLGWLYYALGGLMALILSLLGSVFAAQSQLYEARDNSLLLSMPIRPSSILASRMASLYLDCLLSCLLVLLPAGAAWWRAASASGAQIAAFVLIVLFLPLLGLALACLLGWLSAQIASRTRKKNVVTVVLSLAFMAAYFLVFSRMQQYLQWLLLNSEGVGHSVRAYLFPFYQMGLAAQGDWRAMGLFLVCMIVPFAAACWVLSVGFLHIASGSKGAAKIRYREKTLRVSTPGRALLHREFDRFLASPVYLMNGGIGSLFLVIAAVLMQVKRAMLLRFTSAAFGLRDLLPALICTGISMICAMNTITASSVSMEGKTLWLIQSLPVSGREALRAKLKLHLLFTIPPACLAGLSAAVALRTDLWSAALLIVFPAAYTALTAVIGLSLNLRYPRLDWINETAAVKQGMSLMLTLLCGMALLLVPGGLYALVLSRFLTIRVYVTAVLALTAGGAWLLARRLWTRGARHLAEL